MRGPSCFLLLIEVRCKNDASYKVKACCLSFLPQVRKWSRRTLTSGSSACGRRASTPSSMTTTNFCDASGFVWRRVFFDEAARCGVFWSPFGGGDISYHGFGAGGAKEESLRRRERLTGGVNCSWPAVPWALQMGWREEKRRREREKPGEGQMEG